MKPDPAYEKEWTLSGERKYVYQPATAQATPAAISTGTPYEKAARWHLEHCPTESFREVLEAHLFFGHVISGPDRFVLGRQVNHDWPEERLRDPWQVDEQGDCWMVWLWAGDVKGWLSVVPWPLPWLCWHRGERLAIHRFPKGKWHPRG